jgi:hypothetical protein
MQTVVIRAARGQAYIPSLSLSLSLSLYTTGILQQAEQESGFLNYWITAESKCKSFADKLIVNFTTFWKQRRWNVVVL